MTVRARERATCAAVGPPRDDGVSPVVGMILVLAISIVGIAAILYWGLPAIDELKSNVEYRSMQTQFTELDATIRELVAGTTEKTAKRWQPSLNRGDIVVANRTESWLFAVDLYNYSSAASQPNAKKANITWLELHDGNATFRLFNDQNLTLTQVKVEAYAVSGTSTLTAINVTLRTNLAPTGRAQMTGADLPTWNPDQDAYFYASVRNSGTDIPYDLKDGMFKFRVFAQEYLVAEAYLVTTSRIDYRLHGGIGTKDITYNNGAIITKDAQGAAIVNTPPVPPVSSSTGTARFFARTVLLSGTSSFAGEDRFDLLVSLYATTALASYDCTKPDLSDCATSAKIYLYGAEKDVWRSYLTNVNRGYGFEAYTPTIPSALFVPASDITPVIEQRADKMAFTLLGSTVTLTGGG